MLRNYGIVFLLSRQQYIHYPKSSLSPIETIFYSVIDKSIVERYGESPIVSLAEEIKEIILNAPWNLMSKRVGLKTKMLEELGNQASDWRAEVDKSLIKNQGVLFCFFFGLLFLIETGEHDFITNGGPVNHLYESISDLGAFESRHEAVAHIKSNLNVNSRIAQYFYDWSMGDFRILT